jgi:pimeloyl-ACP methyl ester carboxylesterase
VLTDVTRTTLPAGDGVQIRVLDWGGDGPPVLLHHANGFCAGTWGLVAEALRGDFHVLAVDARGHGDSSKPEGDAAYAWTHFGADLRAVARRLAADLGLDAFPLGVGHSFGAAAMVLACDPEPAPFERLILVDPILPPPPDQEHLDPDRIPRSQYLREGALKRRAAWDSREEARAWWEEKSLFQAWDPRALDLYASEGLVDAPDGGVMLKCPPRVEAAVFGRNEPIDVWGAAARAKLPMWILRAARGHFPLHVHEGFAARAGRCHIEPIDAGHLVPMEAPETLAAAIGRLYDSTG